MKLPQARVDALVGAGEGERFAANRAGRVMKEWFVIAPTSDITWLALAQEAFAFVAALR